MPLWPQTKQRLSSDKYVPLIAVILLLENIQNIISFVSDSDELIFLKFICLSLLISTLALFWQMASCTPASTSILWEQTRPSFARWENTRPWGPTSITPAGSTVRTTFLNHGVSPRQSSLFSGEKCQRWIFSIDPSSYLLQTNLISQTLLQIKCPSSNYCLVKLNPWPWLYYSCDFHSYHFFVLYFLKCI